VLRATCPERTFLSGGNARRIHIFVPNGDPVFCHPAGAIVEHILEHAHIVGRTSAAGR
jgi:hypothetical protein